MSESEFPGDETFTEDQEGYPADDPLGLEGEPAGPAPEPEADPFADVPPPPSGVEQGSLGGVNPSEEAERLKAEMEPHPEPDHIEPGPGDLDEGEEPPVAAVPEEAAALAPEPEAEQDVGLGDELPPPNESEEEAIEEATDQDPLTAPLEGGQDNTQLESGEAEPPEEPEPAAPQPAPKSAAKPRRRRRKGPKLQPGQREYTVLRLWTAPGNGEEPHGALWEEALPDPIIARSGELALRKAFRLLTENTPGTYTLAPVPTKYWNPEEVEGEVPAQALAIKVGGKKK